VSNAGARWVPLAVGVVTAVATIALTGCAAEAPPFPVVPSTLALRPTSIAPPREKLSQVSIPALEGAVPEPTIVFGPGQVTITGRVLGPDGPVPGASVRIERVVGTQSVSTIVIADEEGRYRLSDVEGGQIRLQAFRVPDLGQAESVVDFADKVYTKDLSMERFDGTRVQWAIAPQKLVVGRPANLVIQVGTRRVDEDGVIRTNPIAGIGVTLTPLGSLQTSVLESRLTDSAGRVTYPMVCRTAGAGSIRVALATGEETVIEHGKCAPPPTTAPPTTPPTVAPPTTPAPVPETLPPTVPPTAPPETVTIPAPTVPVEPPAEPTTLPAPPPI
jgi:hypothetical protein